MFYDKKSLFSLCLMIVFLATSCKNNSSNLNQPMIMSPLAGPTHLFSPISPLNNTQNKIPTEIMEPLFPNQIVVKGTGAPGITLSVVDITMVDRVIGTGTINQDGFFAINVTPLTPMHRIGVMLLSPEKVDINTQYFLGDGAVDIPMIGLFLDTAWVSENSIAQ